MKTIPYEKFKHGQRVTCEIDGVKIDDAKISIDSDGTVYICQNYSSLYSAENTLGYTRSHRILYKDMDFCGNSFVSNIQFPRTLDDLEEGDVVRDDIGDEYMVLGICGKVYFISVRNNFKEVRNDFFTVEELKKDGYTLKQEEENELDPENPIYLSEDETKLSYKGKTYILSKYL